MDEPVRESESNEDVFAQHEKRAVKKMKIVVGFFAVVLLLLLLVLVAG